MDDAIADLYLAQAYAEPGATLIAPAARAGMAIANPSQLEAAIATAQGGEVFTLAPGDYGGLSISRRFDPPVTLQGGGEARFSDMSLAPQGREARGGGVVIDGVDAEGIWVTQSDDVAVLNSSVRQIKIARSSGIRVERNHLHDGHFALRFENTNDFQAIGNVMERVREDTMRISGNSFDGIVRGNVFLDNRAAKPMHGDHLQMFGIPGHEGSPHNLTIEQNLFHDDARNKQVFHLKDGDARRNQSWRAGSPGEAAPAQGIFVKDGAGDFVNITIRRNLMRLSMTNSIYIGSGKENYLIEENIVVNVPGHQFASIRLAEFDKQPDWHNGGVLVTRNIVPRIIKETPESIVTADNFVYGERLGGLFAGITGNAGGDRPEDYRPAPGSPIPAYLIDSWLEDTIAVTRATLDSVTPGR